MQNAEKILDELIRRFAYVEDYCPVAKGFPDIPCGESENCFECWKKSLNRMVEE